MNFFEHQDRARRSTVLLVLFYALTVLAIAAAVYLVAIVGWNLYQSSETPPGYAPPLVLWRADVFFNVTAAVLVVILLGTLSKIIELNQGGRVVAEMLDGAPILTDTNDPDERRVLNIVEEMAIASGTAVPPVYYLKQEKGINAFAAGFTTNDAVIGVTDGCVRLLNRDELQGVIAHEFSHILNGDMRLNIRLIGVLNGILLLSLIGRVLMRSVSGRGSGRSRGGGVIALAGLGLFLIGWIGVVFASIIKSALSRQRELLADASGVQFTRYPAGLAGALKKIGGLAQKSYLTHGRAEEASHIFFAEGVSDWLSSLFATHPPLRSRVRALEPDFDGVFPEVAMLKAPEPPLSNKPLSREGLSKIPILEALGAAAVVARTGGLDEARLAYAAKLLDEVPPLLKKGARDPFGACAVVYALLIDRSDPAVKEAQRKILLGEGSYAVYLKLQRIAEEVEKVKPEHRLPLVDLAMPALAMLSPRQYQTFRDNAEKLIQADGKVHPFELALKLVLFHHLDRRFGLKPPAPKADGNKDPAHCAEDLIEMVRRIGRGENGAVDAPRIEEALGVLAAVPFAAKEKVIHGLAEAVLLDRKVTSEELEIIRAFADTLDCPIPPLSPA